MLFCYGFVSLIITYKSTPTINKQVSAKVLKNIVISTLAY